MAVAAEIKALLAEDLPRFLEREIKKAFITHTDFASSLSNERLKSLKAEIVKRGPEAADAVLATLTDDLWLADSSGDDDDRKSISENEPLWERISVISETATTLMAEYGFPTGDEPVEYRPPTWFIGRRYLPSLSEKYWRHVRELAEASTQIGSIVTEVSKSELTKRWDEA